MKAMQDEFSRRFKAPAAQEHIAGGEEREEWEGGWEDEKAASERNEGATVSPAVDLAGHQDASGGGGGGGKLNTPRNGLHARESSRSSRGQRNKMDEDENL